MREFLCALAIVTLVCFIGSGLEAARTADRLEAILQTEVSPMNVWFLPDAADVAQQLEDSAQIQDYQVQGLDAAQRRMKQAALRLADAER